MKFIMKITLEQVQVHFQTQENAENSPNVQKSKIGRICRNAKSAFQKC